MGSDSVTRNSRYAGELEQQIPGHAMMGEFIDLNHANRRSGCSDESRWRQHWHRPSRLRLRSTHSSYRDTEATWAVEGPRRTLSGS
jgi:hypothetical protein